MRPLLPLGRDLIMRAKRDKLATLRLVVNFKPGDTRRGEIIEAVCALTHERAQRVIDVLTEVRTEQRVDDEAARLAKAEG